MREYEGKRRVEAEAAKQEKEKKAEALELDVESGEMPVELDAEIKGMVDSSEKAMEDLAHSDAAGFIEGSKEFAGNTFKGAACTIIEAVNPGAVFASTMIEHCQGGDEAEKEDILKQIEQIDD